MIQTYVTFLFPGSFFSESKSEKVLSREVRITAPKGSFGYYFWDRQETVSEGETLFGERKNDSGMHYFGETFTVEQVKALPGDHETLVWNMEMNKYPLVVRTICGNFQPFNPKKDKLVTQ